MSRAPLPPEQLVRHAEFLRALGRKLLLDAHTIDDASQTTLAVSLEQGPRDPSRARGWLARVFQNAVHQTRRADGRRARRERASARATRAAPTADAVARHEVIQQVADAVDGLSVSYREVIVLRFYEGLPPRRIAERLEAPLATVKSRLARALKQLRETLDARERRGAASWRFALAPIAGLDPSGLGPAALGVATMKTKTAVLVAALAVLAIGGTVLVLDPFASAPPTDRDALPSRLVTEADPGASAARTADSPEAPGDPSRPVAGDEGTGEPAARAPAEQSEADAPARAPRSPPGKGVAGNHGDASRLEAKVGSLRVEDKTFEEVIDTLVVITGANIVLSEKAKAGNHKLTLHYEDVPLRTILNVLAAFTESTWSERSGVIYFDK